jgi:serine phosphatase RsbU (regulator of sigma subunit)
MTFDAPQAARRPNVPNFSSEKRPVETPWAGGTPGFPETPLDFETLQALAAPVASGVLARSDALALSDALNSAARMDAVDRTGLDAAPDPMFDRFAGMVQRLLSVPVALVSIVDPERQFFPGACGLGPPWQDQRQTPLTHSFCQHVVASAEPLIVTDAREDPRVRGNLAIDDLGVVGYAGMPLTDSAGHVLGSLCAIDTSPRQWTQRELDLLADLAAACSDSLRLRIATRHAENSARRAQAEQQRTLTAFDRTQLLLRASVTLAAAGSVGDVIAAVRHLVIGNIDPAYVGVSLLDSRGFVTLASGESLPAEVAQRWAHYRVSARTPSAMAAQSGTPVLLPDMATVAATVPDSVPTFDAMGWQSAASVPLPGPYGAIGALTFVWKQTHVLDDAEQITLTALAGYVAQAIERARSFDDRSTAAATLQKALLTPLPAHRHARLTARYVPAHHADHVGGDWYDAVVVDGNRLAVVIGDVTGHSIDAAATMSQYRSLLRGLLIDRHEPPSAMLRRLEKASRALGVTALASLILVYLDTDDTGRHVLTWSNAGHPPPTLILPDGHVDLLPGHDPILGAVRRTSRRNFSREFPPGARLLLHTDGLVETRTRTIDDGMAELHEAVRRHRHQDLEALADNLMTPASGEREDDAAILIMES